MGDRFEYALKFYDSLGVDAAEAIGKLKKFKLSIHCWQGDDVNGFEDKDGGVGGGLAVTGNYPGRARNIGELMADIDFALSLIPGRHRLNLHAMYPSSGKAGRDKLLPEHFGKWLKFAADRGLGLDFNPTLFAHEKAAGGFTLSDPNEANRRYWIDHCKATRKIAAHFGEALKTPCLHNIWIPDGYKDAPADKLGPRRRLKEALDEIYSVKYDPSHIVDCVESKLFGIGLESYTVGSHEFYMNYAAKTGVLCLFDCGHFHPTETVSDKVSSMLLFNEKIALHVSRGVRWDSDHAVVLDDELRALMYEIVSCGALERTLIGLDFFDATINRVAAWVLSARSVQKAVLHALLTPMKKMAVLQDAGDFTGILALRDALNAAPFGDVWDAFCSDEKKPSGDGWHKLVKEYEETELARRGA